MKYLIWSLEHEAWWQANSNGYTEIRALAGVYSFEEASKIVTDANRYTHNVPNEAMIPTDGICPECDGTGTVEIEENRPDHPALTYHSPCICQVNQE